MNTYTLQMPRRVFSGDRALDCIPGLVRGKYKKAAVFTDPGIHHSGITGRPVSLLRQAGLEVEIFDDLATEPTCDQAQAIIEAFRGTGADLIVAIGGGSVMDVAKLASVAATEDYTVRDMLDDPLIGKKQVVTLMIPTTAGTGAEATPNSIVSVPERELKVGIVNPELMADFVILDSEMTRHLPRIIAASTGADALCHAIECYTSKKANPFSDLFALRALRLIFENLEAACLDPDALDAKNNMLLAAFYGGIAITASGTTAVHALSYPLGGKFHIPHGVANAILLMPVLRFNREACSRELAEVYDAMDWEPLNDGEEKAGRVLAFVDRLLKKLELPSSLDGYSVGRGDLDELVKAGMDVQRLLVNNKRPVTPEDARRMYEEILPREKAGKAGMPV